MPIRPDDVVTFTQRTGVFRGRVIEVDERKKAMLVRITHLWGFFGWCAMRQRESWVALEKARVE